MSIWKKIAAGEEEFSLILESDAVLTREAIDVAERIIKQHADVDMALFSYADCIPSVWEKRRLSERHQLVRFSRKSYLCSAYLLSKKGADELIRHTPSITMPADEIMVGEKVKKEMSIYAVYPRVVYLIEEAFNTSLLRDGRFAKAGGQCYEEKQKRYGFSRLEQIARHFFMGLKRPPKI